jgi:hypothetical protein
MWQAVVVGLAVGLAALWVGRRLWRTLRGANRPESSCGCGCEGPCHQPTPLGGPEPPACGCCAQRPQEPSQPQD